MSLPDGFNFEGLYALGRTTVQPVPEDARNHYYYWRGAHLGNIALNFAQGNKFLNVKEDAVAHFIDWYDFAKATADRMLDENGVHGVQFSVERQKQLARLSGHNPIEPLPTIVFGLGYRFNHDHRIGMSTDAFGLGIAFKGLVTPDMIDPYSRAFLDDLFYPVG